MKFDPTYSPLIQRGSTISDVRNIKGASYQESTCGSLTCDEKEKVNC